MSVTPSAPDSPQQIVFGEDAYPSLSQFLAQDKISKVFVLCDENTQEHCIPFFFQQLSGQVDAEIIETESGEHNKTISTCQQLWATLRDLGADRQSILINLGGGVITDMGGFIASTFLRGIRFINVPTTLLAMVDAAIGGKTGINQEGLKNQIGVFSFPEMTLIDIRYLGTLPQKQLKSGLAEMLKHGLIADPDYWLQLSDLSRLSLADLEDLVKTSIDLKLKIVHRDQRESGLRKILNFGHTLGHAIESYCLESPERPSLLHGEAIAIGMVLESYLSVKFGQLQRDDLIQIKRIIFTTFPKITFSKEDINSILRLLNYDKKNTHGRINFVLLDQIGSPKIDCQVTSASIQEAFAFYAEK